MDGRNPEARESHNAIRKDGNAVKKVLATFLTLLFLVPLTACGSEEPSSPPVGAPDPAVSAAGTEGWILPADGYHPGFDGGELDPGWDESEAVHITLSGESVQVNGEGAQVTAGGVKIGRGGVYVLEGTLDDGRIVADVEPGQPLKIVLDGVSIACSTSAPLYIANGDAVIVLPEGTKNVLSDGEVYQYANEAVKEPNACIYGDDNLSIVGAGELEVRGNFNNGIGSKDELRIVSGKITVRAVNNALKGNDCVLIRDAVLRLESDGDGIKSDEKTMEGYGVIEIMGSSLEIIAKDDALQATSRITALDGEIITQARGKKVNCDGVVAISEGVMK